MPQFSFISLHILKRRASAFLVCFFWIIGLLIGVFLHEQTGAATTMFSRAAVLHPPLIRLCIIRLIPFILLTFCSAFSLSYISFAIIFSKALLYSYCASGIALVFSSAGWLIGMLFLFSDFVAIVLLLWFSARNIAKNRSSLKFDFLLCAVIVLSVCCIEHRVVSPYLIMLLNT